MSIPYYPYAHGVTPAAQMRFQDSVAAATRTFRRLPVARRIGQLFARIAATFRGPASASDAYSARHAKDAAALTRMAHDLETSQPALAAELMLLACR